MTIPRDAALHAIAPHVDERTIVVAVYQACFDWIALYPRDLNYLAVGAMGQAVSHGLGLALACPDRRVIVFDGDGSLLMNLGALVSVAEAAPGNLYHFLFANGTYEVNGNHPVPGGRQTRFADIATAAGYGAAHRFGDMASLEAGLGGVFATPGPVFAELEIVAGASHPRRYDVIHGAETRARFRAALRREIPAR